MTFRLIGHVGSKNAQSAAIDTTDADLLIGFVSSFNSLGTFPWITDTYGNSWTIVGTFTTSGLNNGTLLYCANAITGPNHQFSGNGAFYSLEIQAWQGAIASPLDQNSGAVAFQPGSITPTKNDPLIVCGVATDGTDSATAIDSSFNISDNNTYTGGISVGGALSYKVQTTAGAENPTWTISGSGTPATLIASFFAAPIPSFSGIAKPAFPVYQRIHPQSRGIEYSFPYASSNWEEVASRLPINTAGVAFGNASPLGGGASFSGASEYISVARNSQPPTTWSMEAVAYINSPVGGTFCGWNQNSDGSGATTDRHIYIGTDGKFAAYLYDGASIIARGGQARRGLVHIVGTTDGSFLNLYIDGVLINSVAVSNGGYTSYGLPVYFCTGKSITPFTAPISSNGFSINGILLMANFASVCWSLKEVAQRHHDAFAIYRPRLRLWETVITGPSFDMGSRGVCVSA